jgi:2-methylaconitate cis-trans-isomerase PrpF
MRGGTSTGLVLWDSIAPAPLALREELLRHLMGVPLTGSVPHNRQVTGLGRGPATSNKVFFADVETIEGQTRIVSTLAQLAANHAEIDWSVNCGNMSSALQLWALDAELIKTSSVSIRNVNTGVITTSRMIRPADGRFEKADIPGVMGSYPLVDLFLHDPIGAKTGKLLPTGKPSEMIEGRMVSCVDVAVPMVIAAATEFGKTGYESDADLTGDRNFLDALRATWIEAGLRMGLKRRDGTPMNVDDLARSETIPKICIVAPPRDGGQITVRYFTPQTAHASMAVSGGCCLAAACLLPGTVAHEVARNVVSLTSEFTETTIGIENPAGVLEATVVAAISGASIAISRVAYRRSTQILLRGHVPLYGASDQLIAALAHMG